MAKCYSGLLLHCCSWGKGKGKWQYLLHIYVCVNSERYTIIPNLSTAFIRMYGFHFRFPPLAPSLWLSLPRRCPWHAPPSPCSSTCCLTFDLPVITFYHTRTYCTSAACLCVHVMFRRCKCACYTHLYVLIIWMVLSIHEICFNRMRSHVCVYMYVVHIYIGVTIRACSLYIFSFDSCLCVGLQLMGSGVYIT